jgi:hypothetical protein
LTATGTTDGRRKARRHALHIGKAPENATPEELRAFYAARQPRKSSRSTGSAGSGAGSSTGSGGTSSDCFTKRRPLSDDFATTGSRIGPTFEEARRPTMKQSNASTPTRAGPSSKPSASTPLGPESSAATASDERGSLPVLSKSWIRTTRHSCIALPVLSKSWIRAAPSQQQHAIALSKSWI